MARRARAHSSRNASRTIRDGRWAFVEKPPGCRRLLELGAFPLDDLFPDGNFSLNQGTQLVRCAARRRHATRLHARLDLLHTDHVSRIVVYPLDHGLGQTPGSYQPMPTAHVETWQA